MYHIHLQRSFSKRMLVQLTLGITVSRVGPFCKFRIDLLVIVLLEIVLLCSKMFRNHLAKIVK